MQEWRKPILLPNRVVKISSNVSCKPSTLNRMSTTMASNPLFCEKLRQICHASKMTTAVLQNSFNIAANTPIEATIDILIQQNIRTDRIQSALNQFPECKSDLHKLFGLSTKRKYAQTV